MTKSGKTRMRPTDVRIRLASVGRFLVWANRSRMRAGNLHRQWQEGKEGMTPGSFHENFWGHLKKRVYSLLQ